MAEQANLREEQILTSFRNGAEAGFTAVFDEMYPALCYYGHKITNNLTASEDITGESFIKVWNRREDFDSFIALKAYLYKIVRNASLDWIRKEIVIAKAHQRAAPLLDVSEKTRLEQIIIAETYRELHAAINALPAQTRAVIRLTYFKEMKLREVAAELNIPISTVKSLKYRGLTLLKKGFKQYLSILF